MSGARVLGTDEIHLWSIMPERVGEGELAGFETLLSPEERERRARFSNAELKRDFLIARALVRRSLSAYLPRISPSEWSFAPNAHGRPEITNPGLDLWFNLTHCHGWIGCAIARRPELGLDAEDTTRNVEVEAIARHEFAEEENQALMALPAEQRRERFFELWTLKEAFLKAKGVGIGRSLSQISFDVGPEARVRFSCDPVFGEDPEDWQFELHRPTERHQVAVAVKRGGGPELAVRGFGLEEL